MNRLEQCTRLDCGGRMLLDEGEMRCILCNRQAPVVDRFLEHLREEIEAKEAKFNLPITINTTQASLSDTKGNTKDTPEYNLVISKGT